MEYNYREEEMQSDLVELNLLIDETERQAEEEEIRSLSGAKAAPKKTNAPKQRILTESKPVPKEIPLPGSSPLAGSNPLTLADTSGGNSLPRTGPSAGATTAASSKVPNESQPVRDGSSAGDSPGTMPVKPWLTQDPVEDLILKSKAYYGPVELVHAAMDRTFGELEEIRRKKASKDLKSKERDFYLLSLSYVTLGGMLTELDPHMIPVLQKLGSPDRVRGFVITTDLALWKKAFEEIARRLDAGEEISGVGKKARGK